MGLLEELALRMVRLEAKFLELTGAPDEKISAERLEAIWNKLFGFLSRKRFLTLLDWAGKIGYKYYTPSQKSPIELCEYVRDRLRDLNEEQLTELEAILE